MENRHVQTPLFKSAPEKEPESTEKKNKRKKIAIGISIAAAVLLLILCRKKIKGLFDRSSGSSGSKKPDEPKTPQKPDKPSMPDETKKMNELNDADIKNKENQENLAKYRKIAKSRGEFPSNGTEEQKQNWHKLEDEERRLYGILKENNVSIVEKKNFSTDPNIDFEEKKEYLLELTNYFMFNQASQLDVVGEYEKYFSRYWLNASDNSIRNLTLVCNIVSNNTEHNKFVLDRYLSIMENFAQNDPDGMRDAEIFSFAIEIHYKDVLDENSALRAIEVLKRIAFQQKDVLTIEPQTQKLNSEKVNNSMKELKEIVKNMPYERKYQG